MLGNLFLKNNSDGFTKATKKDKKKRGYYTEYNNIYNI